LHLTRGVSVRARRLDHGFTRAFLRLACASGISVALIGGSTVAATAATDQDTSPIKVGVIVPNDTNVDNRPGVPPAIKAALRAQNKAGGVHGRKLELVYCNNQALANEDLACARQMVSEGVVATVANLIPDGSNANIQSILEQGSVASVDGQAVLPVDANSPNYFMQFPPVLLTYGAKCQAQASLGNKKMFIYYASSVPVYAKVIEAECNKVGVKTVGNLPIPLGSSTPTSYAPLVQAYTSSGADFAMTVIPGTVTQALINQAHVQGAKANWAVNDNAMTPAIIAALGDAAEGVMLDAPVPPLTDTTNEGVKQFKDEMNAYRKATGDSNADVSKSSNNDMIAWIGAHAVIENLKTMPEGDAPTPAAFLKQLSSAKALPVPVWGPWTPTPGPTGYSSVSGFKAYIETVKNGKYKLFKTIDARQFAEPAAAASS
jgi:ABC-type branched-subunit amino acid transport system substrate-binding protein